MRLRYGACKACWDTITNPFTADWSNTAAEVGASEGHRSSTTGTARRPAQSRTFQALILLVLLALGADGAQENPAQSDLCHC